MSYCRLLLTPRMTLLIVIGSLIYSVGLNQFIVPVGLYNGGFLGIAQLIRHFMESWFGISFGNTNIAGILYFILNIPSYNHYKKEQVLLQHKKETPACSWKS